MMDNFEPMRKEDPNVVAAFYAEINRIKSGARIGDRAVERSGVEVVYVNPELL